MNKRCQESYDGSGGLQYAAPLPVYQAALILNHGLWHGDLDWIASECQPDVAFPSIMHRIWDTFFDDGEYVGPSTEAEAIKAVSDWAGNAGTVYVDEDGCITENHEDFCYCKDEIEFDDDPFSCAYCCGEVSVVEVNVAEAILPKEVYSTYC